MKLDYVPVIDIAPFWSGNSADRELIAAQVDKAVREIGFLVIEGHGVPDSLLDAVDSACKAFFDLPLAQKLAIQNTVHGSQRGYIPMGGETLSYSLGQAAPPDLKEGFGMGRPYFYDDEKYPEDVRQALFSPNVWPEGLPEMERAMTLFYREMDRVTQALLMISAVALQLPEDFFVTKFNRPASAIRVNNYPAQDKEPEPGQIRAGAHTDYGALTILRPDYMIGGLEVRNFKGQWVEAPLIGGSFIVNIGDMMMRWTNDCWLSNMHRVVNPPSGGNERRQSIGFFASPNLDTVIECIPSCQSAHHPAKYPPRLAAQSRLEKLRATIDQGQSTTA